MPFYEYECVACGHQTEVLQKISDVPLRKCPDCGKSALKKLVSAPVFRLKGSGWYETDFKSDKEEKRNLVKDDAPAESKSEAKPESSEPKAAPPAKSESAEPKKTVVSKPAAKPTKAAAKSAAKAAKKPVKPAAKAKKKARR